MAFEAYQKRSGIQLPKLAPLSAVSVGIVDGAIVTDLCYVEDSAAHVDMNVVASGDGVVEVQGTGEEGPFSRAQFNALLDAGMDACGRVQELQLAVLKDWRQSQAL
jgi:ribonuclease PH